ncbi:mechanosensitive ion channel domain-containing protein [Photobacterium nomapromontoriensis]|uniref:mechanosensitive ion channel domain-containing protein n=1 Tax=Photobacterium nomapromontoriensis TaxID=2910237 RepID=UPI003D0F1D83
MDQIVAICITIRDLTGVIAKIQTHETTIIDFDQKKVIVPNRALSINVHYVANTRLPKLIAPYKKRYV